ncbi:MAG: AAC(3) family N-acetyltransferase [Methanobacteriota archaeon]|nr:MAG: AAC(3) family N-acetyltransferase [Euryarchaeota archaeon]
MSERDAIEKTEGYPVTIRSLGEDLAALGVTKDIVLLAHSSLSSLGWVCGGPMAVVMALEEAVGEKGTLVMPTHSGDFSEPSLWRNPPVPKEWWETIRNTMPAFDANMTPTRGMGAIPECFRKQSGTLRGNHPTDSFAARGPLAHIIVGNQPVDFPMGENSPLARIYDLDGWVILIGVGFQCATSLHLAETRSDNPCKKTVERGGPMTINGKRRWVRFNDIEWDDSDFDDVGAAFMESGMVRRGRLGCGIGLLMSQRSLVDYATRWMSENRE